MIKGDASLGNANTLEPSEGQLTPKKRECSEAGWRAGWGAQGRDPIMTRCPPSTQCCVQTWGCPCFLQGGTEGWERMKGWKHPSWPLDSSSPITPAQHGCISPSIFKITNQAETSFWWLDASCYHRCLNALTYIDILVQRLIITGYS